MGRHLVLVGGGHAHLTLLVNLATSIERGHRVTLIGPSPYHYYSGMGPGLLSGIYRPQDVRFHAKKMVEERGALSFHSPLPGYSAACCGELHP